LHNESLGHEALAPNHVRFCRRRVGDVIGADHRDRYDD
jgi:hypothetical protein